MYVQNGLEEECAKDDMYIIVKLTVDDTLEPHWVVKSREGSDIDDKPISGADRALIAVNFITDYTDNQFAYNRQSPLYALTKTKLAENKTIERIKSELIRSMALSAPDDVLEPLNKPLNELKLAAEKLGLNATDLCAQLDIKENPYTGNSISLHDNSLPYRLHGKGSKRLMSIAIQSEMTKYGGIVLIDEIEQGLEPDRIITLVRILKTIASGQVFITTHSLNVVLEAEWHNLFIVNKGANTLYVLDEEFNGCRRSNPQALFARKIICCEGKTELGFLRRLDSWILEKYKTNFSSKGVVLVDAAGGNKMFTYAEKLKELGYDTCVFADNDKADELNKWVEEAKNSGIKMFLCENGNCFEGQLIKDLPWEYITEIVNCTQEGFPRANIKFDTDINKEINEATDENAQNAIRERIIGLSITKDEEWFKHIPGGEFLGSVFVGAYDKIDGDKKMKENVESLLNWCDIK